MSISDELEELIETGYIKHCVTDVRKIEDKIRFLETIHSELGIAFDDLRRERDELIEALNVLPERWRFVYRALTGESTALECAKELEDILEGEE